MSDSTFQISDTLSLEYLHVFNVGKLLIFRAMGFDVGFGKYTSYSGV